MDKSGSLKKEIAERGNLLIAFSGGVDSSFLAKLAYDVLGGNALAVTVDSETLPRSELEAAKRVAKEIGIRHKIVRVSLNPRMIENTRDRCYYCKKEIARVLRGVGREEGLDTIADGASFSDCDEYRPGIKAAGEEGIWHPLMDFKFKKEEIREYARAMGLSNWDKPSMACLSSRIPYGSELTVKKLKRVEKAEEFLKSKGLGQVRVRDHDGVARIEVAELDKFLKLDFKGVHEKLRGFGFDYVTLDLKGYRAGSMNETL
jgi:uncharacterized protein